jgi:hypothetical protein
MIENLSACLAMFDSKSPICMPGTFVEIGKNGPRIVSGAKDLGSHMSRRVIRLPFELPLAINEIMQSVPSSGRDDSRCEHARATVYRL